MIDRAARLQPEWRETVGEAVAWLDARGFAGRTGLILGSGLGNFVEVLDDAEAVGYGEIPGFTTTSVAEHRGQLVAGEAAGRRVLVMQGRLHPYEGLPAEVMLLPAAVLACLGIDEAVVTNAAGGLNVHYVPGDLMVIRDHLDLHLGDPLRALLVDPSPPDAAPGRGARPSAVYDVELARLMLECGAATGVPLHDGVYASMWGPAYETKAEIGMLRKFGCDAVGMSTAPEVMLLGALGVRVAGLSCITNPAREVGQPELSHQDVVEAGLTVRDRMARLLLAFLPRLDA
ncbi:purine-nucleoside phosphorylase [bacterium]|nr:purine-nucleoside phosphorylase [bacterium]MBU1073235.1 purine-nucleoside phosphorylase [bacterium]MBU1674149.1 purine-nucleoside phosphorylase [bacterium]